MMLHYCLVHGCRCLWDADAQDYTCRECDQESAGRGLMQATTEAMRLLDDGPERYTHPSQFETELPF